MVGTRAPRQARSRAAVEAIVEGATRVLERDGAAALTTNRIAARAGVGIASLYWYFPNKQAIVDEIARRRDDAMHARLAPHVEGGSVGPLVEAWVEGHADSPALHRALLELRPSDPARQRRCVLDAMRILALDETGAWALVTMLRESVARALVERPEDLRSGALRRALHRMLA